MVDDPSGSLIFISKLFTGLISNKDLTKQIGFLSFLKRACNCIQNEDALWLIKDSNNKKTEHGHSVIFEE
jgi:hypothetical protein